MLHYARKKIPLIHSFWYVLVLWYVTHMYVVDSLYNYIVSKQASYRQYDFYFKFILSNVRQSVFFTVFVQYWGYNQKCQ